MFKKVYILIILLLLTATQAGSEEIKINNQKIEKGTTLNIFRLDLDDGKILFAISDEKITKAEISLDSGKNWQEMEIKEGAFSFGYKPLNEEVVNPEFILTEASGSMRTLNPNIRINYQSNTPDEKVQQLLDKMQSFYESENMVMFISLFSPGYPDRIKFQEAIQQDFYNYKNVRLHYRIERKTFDESYSQAIWDVYWQRKYDNRSGASYSDSSTITMLIEREGSDWLITGMNHNAIFGSNLLSSADLKVSSADINIVDVAQGQVTVSSTVHNIGLAGASNVKVSFYQKLSTASSYALIDSKTISSIAATNQATSDTVSFTGNALTSYDFKVVVDPDFSISESEETNNTATRTYILP